MKIQSLKTEKVEQTPRQIAYTREDRDDLPLLFTTSQVVELYIYECLVENFGLVKKILDESNKEYITAHEGDRELLEEKLPELEKSINKEEHDEIENLLNSALEFIHAEIIEPSEVSGLVSRSGWRKNPLQILGDDRIGIEDDLLELNLLYIDWLLEEDEQ